MKGLDFNLTNSAVCGRAIHFPKATLVLLRRESSPKSKQQQ